MSISLLRVRSDLTRGTRLPGPAHYFGVEAPLFLRPFPKNPLKVETGHPKTPQQFLDFQSARPPQPRSHAQCLALYRDPLLQVCGTHWIYVRHGICQCDLFTAVSEPILSTSRAVMKILRRSDSEWASRTASVSSCCPTLRSSLQSGSSIGLDKGWFPQRGQAIRSASPIVRRRRLIARSTGSRKQNLEKNHASPSSVRLAFQGEQIPGEVAGSRSAAVFTVPAGRR